MASRSPKRDWKRWPEPDRWQVVLAGLSLLVTIASAFAERVIH